MYNRWTNEWMNRQIDGWIARLMDEWKGGWIRPGFGEIGLHN